MRSISTVGHGARSQEEFLQVLREAGVELLVDVRRYPGSKRHPHFGKASLAAELPSHGIRYEWWGQSLGGRRKADAAALERHGGWKNEAFRAYASHMDSSEFRAALQRLMEVSGETHTAIMCAETLWWRCHRRLIADALTAEGRQVMHLGMGEPHAHRMTEIARLDDQGLLAYDRYSPRLWADAGSEPPADPGNGNSPPA